MIAQQPHRFIDQFAFVLRAGPHITLPQFPQHLHLCRFSHRHIHVLHGNRTFGTTTLFLLHFHPPSGNKTFGAIRSTRARSTSDSIDAPCALTPSAPSHILGARTPVNAIFLRSDFSVQSVSTPFPSWRICSMARASA